MYRKKSARFSVVLSEEVLVVFSKKKKKIEIIIKLDLNLILKAVSTFQLTEDDSHHEVLR